MINLIIFVTATGHLVVVIAYLIMVSTTILALCNNKEYSRNTQYIFEKSTHMHVLLATSVWLIPL